MPIINPKCKPDLTKIKLNGNVTIINFSRVEFYFMERIWDLLEALMTLPS